MNKDLTDILKGYGDLESAYLSHFKRNEDGSIGGGFSIPTINAQVNMVFNEICEQIKENENNKFYNQMEIYNGSLKSNFETIIRIVKQASGINEIYEHLSTQYEEEFDWHEREKIDNERKRVKTDLYALLMQLITESKILFERIHQMAKSEVNIQGIYGEKFKDD